MGGQLDRHILLLWQPAIIYTSLFIEETID